jgi:hypothetical protein
LVFEKRSGAVNGIVKIGFYRAEVVDWIAKNVEDAAKSAAAHGNHDGSAGIDSLHAADQTFSGLESDGANAAFTEVLGNLDDDVDWIRCLEAFGGNANGVVNIGQFALFEEDVDDRSDNLDDVANPVASG